MRKLIVYPNCSKGGVTSVIRGRAAAEPTTVFDVVFLNDRGGSNAFADLSNVNIRILRKDRSVPYLKAIANQIDYTSIHVLSSPELANALSEDESNVVMYEFHSSNMRIVEEEIDKLNIEKLAQIWVPSAQMEMELKDLLSRRDQFKLHTEQNLVDKTLFNSTGKRDFFNSSNYLLKSKQPLIWVGRFDKDKGYQYAVRLLSQLPDEFICCFVVSLEHDPSRISTFLSECDAMGVRNRIELYMNLSQVDMANLYRSASDRNGMLISTSLMESFGYAIAEAVSCELKVVAFDLPVLELHSGNGEIVSIPAGDIDLMAEVIQSN